MTREQAEAWLDRMEADGLKIADEQLTALMANASESTKSLLVSTFMCGFLAGGAWLIKKQFDEIAESN